MRLKSSITSIFFILMLCAINCNKAEPNEPPVPCISGPWLNGNGASNDYLEWSVKSPLSVSAKCSTDSDSDTLTVRWDWNSDGNWDTHFISIYTTVQHQYQDTGWYELNVSVDDGKIAIIESARVHIKQD